MDMVAVLIYLVLRFCFNTQLDALGPWTLYAVEAIFALGALAYYRKSWREWVATTRELFWLPIVALIAGLFSAYGAVTIGLPVPFDLTSTSGVLMLLVGAPLLEEVLFRLFLWEPIARRGKLSWAWSFTTILFAYSHWHPVWNVPAEWHGFLAYQTLYTLLLGLACGSMIFLYNSLLAAVVVHFAFNLGFWLMLSF